MVFVNDKHRRIDKKVKKDRDDGLNRETDNKAIRQSNSLCQEVTTKHSTTSRFSPYTSFVLYNRTEKSQGFFICFMIKNPLNSRRITF